MVCRYCGNNYPDSLNRCPSCGASNVPAAAQQQAPQQAPQPNQAALHEEAFKNKRKGLTGLLVVALLFNAWAALRFFTGAMFGPDELVGTETFKDVIYNHYAGLETITLLSGVISVVAAVACLLCIIVLSKKRKSTIPLMILGIGAGILSTVVFTVAVIAIIGISAEFTYGAYSITLEVTKLVLYNILFAIYYIYILATQYKALAPYKDDFI